MIDKLRRVARPQRLNKRSRNKHGRLPPAAATVDGDEDLNNNRQLPPGSPLAASVLVLNRSYMAVHLVNVRRALSLVFRSIADIIDVEEGQYAAYDFPTWREICEFRQALAVNDQSMADPHADWIRAVNFSIQAPRVIRLVEFDRSPRQTLRFNRRNLFARDNNRCQYCGDHYPQSQLSLDHVLPRSRGGGNTWENVVCSCLDCNSRKGNRTPKEAHMQLQRQPGKPKQSPILSIKLGDPRYEIWKTFLPTGGWQIDAN